MNTKLIGVATAGLLLSAFLAPVPAGAAEPEPPGSSALNITETPDGRKIAREAIARFELAAAAHGGNLDPTNAYEVYTQVPGDSPDAIWVVPVDAGLPSISAAGGTTTAVFAPEPAPMAASAVNADPPYLVEQPVTCSERLRAPGVDAYMDRCGQWSYVANSPDRVNGHYSYKQWATCWSSMNWWLASCELKGALDATSGPATWEDWAPRSDTDGACRPINLSISFGGISVGGSYSGCERNVIYKGAPAGEFGSDWRGWVFGQSRETAYRIALASPLGGKGLVMRAQWKFTYALNRP